MSKVKANAEQELVARILRPDIADDPEAFVMYAFPWGKRGTPLERHTGPRAWQRRVLAALREFIAAMQAHDYVGAEDKLEVFRKAIASGRGIGKSALIAWIIYWFMSTRIGGTCIVSANTETQLRTVTWGELGKWHAMLINKHWFDISATALKPAKWFDELVQNQLKRGTKYYYAEAKLWSEENPDAYAGAHNPLGMLLVFDEASGIVTPIWTVAEGYFTEPIVDRYWLAFSNPRSVSGAFFDCFGKNRRFWRTEQIDSRTVEGTDKQIYQKIIDQYGDDSDEARVEVYGQFPRVGTNQFIPLDLVRMAQDRELVEDKEAPLLMGVDVARFGDDESVIAYRRGRDARTKNPKTYKGVDTSTLAVHVANAIECENPDAVFIDGAGVGGGVIDRLRQLGYKVIEVQAGSSADAADKYLNKRVEMWGLLREWLKTGCLSKNEQLEGELIAPEYEITPKGQIKLEPKESMKKRGVASPDMADALALTFAHKVGYKADLSREKIQRSSAFDRRNEWFGGSIDGGWMI